MIHQHQVPDAQANEDTDQRSRQVRVRLGRAVLPLVIAAVALCGLVVWQRDARHIESAKARLQAYIPSLERYLTENGTLPSTYPAYEKRPKPGTDEFELRYADPQIIAWARKAEQKAMIGFGKVNGLIARPNGNAVIYFDKGSFSIDWLSSGQLGAVRSAQRAAATGESPPNDQTG